MYKKYSKLALINSSQTKILLVLKQNIWIHRKKNFLKQKQWLLKNQTHGSFIKTTFIFKTRIQYKKDKIF